MGSLSQAGLLIYTRVVFRPNQPCVMGIIWSESRVPKGRENSGHFGTADFLQRFSRETFFEINCCPEFSGIFPEVSRRVPISPEKIGTEHKKAAPVIGTASVFSGEGCQTPRVSARLFTSHFTRSTTDWGESGTALPRCCRIQGIRVSSAAAGISRMHEPSSCG